MACLAARNAWAGPVTNGVTSSRAVAYTRSAGTTLSADRVYATARELVTPFVTGPAQALRAAKQAIDAGLEMDLAAGLAWESQLFAALFATDDRAEGMAAFVEKRKPNFTGR